jgi:hypothetical protein
MLVNVPNYVLYIHVDIIKKMFDQVEEGFTVTAEEILGRLNSALLHNQHNRCCNSTDE